jgi:hypothetical protein
MKLREDRSFGTVYGHSQIAFEQDGRQYGHDKVLLEGPITDPAPSPEVAKAPDPARSAKMKAIWEQKRAQKAAEAQT